MKGQPSSVRMLPEQTILPIWREQVTQAAQTPALRQQLLCGQHELLPKFAEQYQRRTMKRLTPITRWFSRTPGLWLPGILVSLVLGSLSVCAAYAAGPADVSFPGKIMLKDGRMTARIVAAPLRRVIEEVSKLSGAQARGLSRDGEEPVSVEFTDLPFSEALRRILGEKDFVLFDPSARERARLPQIWIYPREQAVGQLVAIQEGETTPPALSDAGPSVERPPVEQHLDSLMHTAIHDHDPSVRLDAITQLGGYAQEDLLAETALSQVAHSDSDPQLREAAAELLQNMQ